jgi:hypothetical protein
MHPQPNGIEAYPYSHKLHNSLKFVNPRADLSGTYILLNRLQEILLGKRFGYELFRTCQPATGLIEDAIFTG